MPSNQGDIRYVTLWIPLILGVKVLHSHLYIYSKCLLALADIKHFGQKYVLLLLSYLIHFVYYQLGMPWHKIFHVTCHGEMS